jgi:CRP-like cAMP-binding protein
LTDQSEIPDATSANSASIGSISGEWKACETGKRWHRTPRCDRPRTTAFTTGVRPESTTCRGALTAASETSPSNPRNASPTRPSSPHKFYLIRSGAVDVLKEDESGRSKLGALQRGEVFGEAALLTGEPRNATVVASETLEAYSLGKGDFQAVVMASPSFEDELRRVLFGRQ